MAGTLEFLYDDGQWSMAKYPLIYGRMQWRSMADVQRRLERGFFLLWAPADPSRCPLWVRARILNP